MDLFFANRDQLTLKFDTLPAVNIITSIRSLYLAPFPHSLLHIICDIGHARDLITTLVPYLRRLVIDMPLGTLQDWRDPIDKLRDITKLFAALTNIEVFCSVRDEFLPNALGLELPIVASLSELPVWCNWTNLTTLALYNVFLEPQFAEQTHSLTQSQRLFLTCPESDVEDVVNLCNLATKLGDVPDVAKELTVTLVNIHDHHTPLVIERTHEAKEIYCGEESGCAVR